MSAPMSGPAEMRARTSTFDTATPLVSVVIPTHNRVQLLARAIQSALAQTDVRVEVIVVDDGSTDATQTTMRALKDARVRYLRQDTSRGGAAARNTGIRAARGEYIAFLDDDDEWEPHKLREQLKLLQRYQVVLCGYYGEENGPGRRYQSHPTVDLNELRHGFLRGGGTSALVGRADIIRETSFDESLPRCQDWDVCIRLAKRHTIGYVRQPLVKYNDGDHARISNKIRHLPLATLERELRMVEKHKDFFGRRMYRFHMARLLLLYIKHRPDRWRHVAYVCRRYGVWGVLLAGWDRLRLKVKQRLAFS